MLFHCNDKNKYNVETLECHCLCFFQIADLAELVKICPIDSPTHFLYMFLLSHTTIQIIESKRSVSCTGVIISSGHVIAPFTFSVKSD